MDELSVLNVLEQNMLSELGVIYLQMYQHSEIIKLSKNISNWYNYIMWKNKNLIHH